MADAPALAKAQLIEIELGDGDANSEATNPEADVTVQFNPETLKVGYSNTMEGNDQSGGSAIQYVSKSSTKLSVELWFDATVHEEAKDVRELTKKVNHFFTPQPKGDGLAPPAVRFLWGSFLFEGVMDSMDETLELFSAEGRPLRAKVSIGITSQKIMFKFGEMSSSGAGSVPGTKPQSQARQDDSIQQMMGRSGSSSDWRSVASANGIENPRQLTPGSFVDLSATATTTASAAVSTTASEFTPPSGLVDRSRS